MKSSFKIQPEFSAQGIRKSPNPMLPKVMDEIDSNQMVSVKPRKRVVVDLGCGQLRHAAILQQQSGRLILVDTKDQIERRHDFFGESLTLPEYAHATWRKKNVEVIENTSFATMKVGAHIIFCINVLDVVPRRGRAEILASAMRNLADDGLFVAIVPRNDTWTMRICTDDARYDDGYVFKHPKCLTYYRNWPSDSLKLAIQSYGFRIRTDMSIHRYVCLICTK